MLKASVLLPAGNGKFPDPIFVNDYEDIQREVGGVFTTVSMRGQVHDNDVNVIGFVPDDIVTADETTMNWFASALFGQEVYGPCVVAWALSPNGEYDGDIYDMPDFLSEYIFGEFTEFVVRAYGQATSMTRMFQGAVTAGIITDDELESLMQYIEALTNDDTERYTDAEKVNFMLLLNAVEAHVLRNSIEEGEE
jgi:hypothetical protein